jgi:uncharacterized protein YegJ (DUF2314 family)
MRSRGGCSDMAWTLDDAVAKNRRHPDTFHIPLEQDVADLRVGDYAKLIFMSNGEGERMWVQITKIGRTGFTGTLANSPVVIDGLTFGAAVTFQPHNVIDVMPGEML